MARGHQRRCIFLTGAPQAENLSWSETTLTAKDGYNRNRWTIDQVTSSGSSVALTPRWRIVAGKDGRSSRPAEFLSAADLQHDPDAEDFVDHSFLQLEAMILPDLLDLTSTSQEASGDITIESFYTEESSSEHHMQDTTRTSLSSLPRQLLITDLKDVLTASELDRIAPQTVTIHILVGVISVQPVRTVQLRRTKMQMELIEVIVGDESRAGFAITFWLVPKDDLTEDKFRRDVEALRPGDIVVIGNVALNSYQGCVYGQSLNRRDIIARTRIWPLQPGQRNPEALAAKISRVAQWRGQFLNRNDGRNFECSDADRLPPDTP